MDTVLPILFEIYEIGDLPHYVPILFGMCCIKMRDLCKKSCSPRLQREVGDVCKNIFNFGEQFLGKYNYLDGNLGRTSIPYFQFVINENTKSIHSTVEGNGPKITIRKQVPVVKDKFDYQEMKQVMDPHLYVKRISHGVSYHLKLRTIPGIGLLVLQYFSLQLPPQIVVSLLKTNIKQVRDMFQTTEQFDSWLMSFVLKPGQVAESYLRSDALSKRDKLGRWLRENFALELVAKNERVERLGHPRFWTFCNYKKSIPTLNDYQFYK